MSTWQWSFWDDEMIQHLRPIAEEDKPPNLELLFFANTFPLAFHYALALRKYSKYRRKINQQIQLGNWKETSKADDQNVIKYTNVKNSGSAFCIPVTIFKPKWVFVPLTLGTSRLWHSLPSVKDAVKKGIRKEEIEPQLSEFLKLAKNAGFDHVWIYAELSDLGVYLSNIVKEQNSFETTIFAGDAGVENGNDSLLPLFEPVNKYPNILRLFIYGGSLSSYLREKYNRYLPLQLPDSNNGNNLMKTFVSCPESHANALMQYHVALYQAAKNENNVHRCPYFFTVYRGYNEMAWLLQHRSHFKDAKKFATCLIDHHKDPT